MPPLGAVEVQFSPFVPARWARIVGGKLVVRDAENLDELIRISNNRDAEGRAAWDLGPPDLSRCSNG